MYTLTSLAAWFILILLLFTLAGCKVGEGFNSFSDGYLQGYSVGQGGVYIPPPRPPMPDTIICTQTGLHTICHMM